MICASNLKQQEIRRNNIKTIIVNLKLIDLSESSKFSLLLKRQIKLWKLEDTLHIVTIKKVIEN